MTGLPIGSIDVRKISGMCQVAKISPEISRELFCYPVHGRCRALGQRKRRPDCLGPLSEQAHRLLQRRHRPSDLARDAERLTAGGQNLQIGTPLQESGSEIGTVDDHMLAVVQDQQYRPIPKNLDQCLGRRLARPFSNSDSRRYGPNHFVRPGDRGEIHHPQLASKDVDQLAGNGQR
jgi:hypothetical protein